MTATKFRTMLAPIGMSTGDGRRFADGSITVAPVPFSLEWAREREGGHDGAVSVGVVQEAAVLSVKDAIAGDWVSTDKAKGLKADMVAVWAKGTMFDDADREDMPRLAEDVAESMHLASNGTLGPSVDLDSFEAVPVFEGTDEPVSWETVEAYYEEHGEEPKLELLITEGRVRAATLVSIPAFQETSRPFELIEEGESALALVASVGAADTRPPIAAFTRPSLDGPTPITWNWETGRVFGHIATWRTCHVGYSDVCVTAPRAGEAGYTWFNRFSVETVDGGMVGTGRLTVGGSHAGLALSASSAMAHHDALTVAADVVAYEDDHGIVVAGVARPGLDGATMAILERRKVSGDWRAVGAELALVEVLALSPGPRSQSEPGFPVQTYGTNTRQLSLTASFGPEDVPGTGSRTDVTPLNVAEIVRQARQAERDLAAADAAREKLAAVLAPETERARADLAALVGEGETGV